LKGKESTVSWISPDSLPAIQVLRQSPILALRHLTLEETETAVIIRGHVPSYYLKQLAQEALRPVLADRQLVNEVHVVREEVEFRLEDLPPEEQPAGPASSAETVHDL